MWIWKLAKKLHLAQEVNWVLAKKLMRINVSAVRDSLAGFAKRVSDSVCGPCYVIMAGHRF